MKRIKINNVKVNLNVIILDTERKIHVKFYNVIFLIKTLPSGKLFLQRQSRRPQSISEYLYFSILN